jgi:hypothetical protein
MKAIYANNTNDMLKIIKEGIEEYMGLFETGINSLSKTMGQILVKTENGFEFQIQVIKTK